MKTYKRQTAQRLMVTVLLLALPMSIYAWEPNARDRDAAIKSGNLDAYAAKIGKWVSRKVPTSITKKSIDALFKNPKFMSAIIERRFITRVWGPPNLGDWAKADPKNAKFVSWVMSNPEIMNMALLTRTPSAGWARVDDSWSIHIAALMTWQKIYYADPASRKGLYLRIAVACTLRPPGTGNHGAGQAKEQSSCLDRYMYYHKAHAAKELFPSFDTLTTWELTHVVSSPASNLDLSWGREALNTWNPGFRRNQNVVTMVSQVWRRGSQVPYHDFSCVAAGGGKCGPRSSFGVFINQAFGIPSIGVGQPGHAAVAWRGRDGNWQIGYGRGWNVSKLFDRNKMSGGEFVAMTKERKTPIFAWTEHLRWLAGTLEKPDGGYLPPDNRQYANPRATAVYALRNAAPAVYGNIKGTKAAAAAKSDFKPERPIKVAPGVIHVEAEDFFTKSNVGVENCYTGGKQVYYPALTAHAMCGYKINVPKTGTYGFTARGRIHIVSAT